MRKLPASRRIELKGTVVFSIGMLFSIFNLPIIGVPLLLLSFWIASNQSSMNISGIVYMFKSLPALIARNHVDIISIGRKALNGDNRIAPLFDHAASSAICLKQYEESLPFCNRLILLNYDDPRGYSLRGETNFQLGKFDDSLHDFNKAIDLEPKQKNAFKLKRARTLIALADYLAALNDLDDFKSSSHCTNELEAEVDLLRTNCIASLKSNH
ncbi:MAG: hypothetical protein KIT34_16600 [Cyanobacteria bacterium TGS_CYA1]|nr:hypothetical protein [Cyanobacteria bacterium TGS_CYA1]